MQFRMELEFFELLAACEVHDGIIVAAKVIADFGKGVMQGRPLVITQALIAHHGFKLLDHRIACLELAHHGQAAQRLHISWIKQEDAVKGLAGFFKAARLNQARPAQLAHGEIRVTLPTPSGNSGRLSLFRLITGRPFQCCTRHRHSQASPARPCANVARPHPGGWQ